MTYTQTLDWLFNQLPAYQKIGKSAYKVDLSNILELGTYLKNPHKKFKSIHVGGTNGKGSSSHMLASVLQEAGYKVGLYTSPHLKDFRERIKINGLMVSEGYVVDFVRQHKRFFQDNQLSFFEMTVGLAYAYFAEQEVDIAIIEVGLGGRLDSTNIINPEVSLITNIGLDHTAILGDNLVDIAKEKAGIIKKNTPIVISETQSDIASVFTDYADEMSSTIIFADKVYQGSYKTDLLGLYQLKNIKGVVATIHQLKGFDVLDSHIYNGLMNVVKNTNLLGRWQILQERPTIICDTAHNKEGLSITMNQLKALSYSNLHIVFGVVSDKNLGNILPLLPKEANYYFCAPNIFRAMPVTDLFNQATAFGLNGVVCASVSDALCKAKRKAKDEDVVYIGGSTFVVAEIL